VHHIDVDSAAAISEVHSISIFRVRVVCVYSTFQFVNEMMSLNKVIIFKEIISFKCDSLWHSCVTLSTYCKNSKCQKVCGKWHHQNHSLTWSQIDYAKRLVFYCQHTYFDSGEPYKISPFIFSFKSCIDNSTRHGTKMAVLLQLRNNCSWSSGCADLSYMCKQQITFTMDYSLLILG
jgi:hypothetical protein